MSPVSCLATHSCLTTMLVVRPIAAALFALLALAPSAEAKYKGMGTAYSGAYKKDLTGFNSCQFGFLGDTWETYYAALPSNCFEHGSHCGECIRARGTESDAPGKWVKVKIVDECASCTEPHKWNGVDFSIPALKAITGYEWDRKGIEWEWTSCDGDVNAAPAALPSPSQEGGKEGGEGGGCAPGCFHPESRACCHHQQQQQQRRI